jgi:hypothetical protein
MLLRWRTARDIRCVGRAAAQALDRRLLVAERGKECERELIGGDRGASKVRYSFLDLNSVYANPSLRRRGLPALSEARGKPRGDRKPAA